MKYQGYPVVGGNQNLTSLTIERNKAIVQNISNYDTNSDLTMDIMREQAIASVNELQILPFSSFNYEYIENDPEKAIYYLISKQETLYIDKINQSQFNKQINFISKQIVNPLTGELEPLSNSTTLNVTFSSGASNATKELYTEKFDINFITVYARNLEETGCLLRYLPKSYTDTRYFWEKTPLDIPLNFDYVPETYYTVNPDNSTPININLILCKYKPLLEPFTSNNSTLKSNRVLLNYTINNSICRLSELDIIANNSYGGTANQKISTLKYVINNSILNYNVDSMLDDSSKEVLINESTTYKPNLRGSINIDLTPALELETSNTFDEFVIGKETYWNHKIRLGLNKISTGEGYFNYYAIFSSLNGNLIEEVSTIGTLNPKMNFTTGVFSCTLPADWETANSSLYYSGLVKTKIVSSITTYDSFNFKDSTVLLNNGCKFGYFSETGIVIPTNLEACLLRPIDNNNVTVTDFSKKVSCYKAPLIENGIVVSEILNMRLPEYNNAYDKEINGKVINADNWLVDSQRISGSSIYESLIYQVLSKPVMDFLTVGTGASPLYGLTLSVASSEISQLNRKTYVLNIDSSEYTDIRAINIESDIVITNRPDIDLTGFYFNKYGVFKADGTEYFPSWAENFFILAKDPIDDSMHILGVVQNRVIPSRFSDNNKIVFDDGQYDFVSAFQILQPLDNNITNTFISVQSQNYPDNKGVGSVQFLDLTPSMTISQFSIF